MTRHAIDLFIAAILICGMAFLFGAPHVRAAECTKASWYGTESGNKTANGDNFDGTSMTAAHKTLPFGTKLRVTFNGKSVIVRTNDRGPFVKGRGLDLSKAAFAKLAPLSKGVIPICYERL